MIETVIRQIDKTWYAGYKNPNGEISYLADGRTKDDLIKKLSEKLLRYMN